MKCAAQDAWAAFLSHLTDMYMCRLGQQKDSAHVQQAQLSKDLSTSQMLASQHAAEAEKVAAALDALQASSPILS